MTFISYAQNYEDVMLHRALKGVEKGFYIDVGANDPVQYSVTKAFYERGWRGINIEPIDAWYERLTEERPEDINLKVAVTDQPGILKLFDVLGSGLSTASGDVADRHRESGFETRELFVPALTLESICRDYKVGDVHFLKVDVEGAERQVLASIALEAYRPWIILVEATAPMSEEENHHLWSSLLTDRGYDQVYFDGLNQFYVAREHAELGEAFRKPPNVFDRFVPHELVIARNHGAAAEAELARVEAELDRVRNLAEERGKYGSRVEAELDRVRKLVDERGEHSVRVEAELDRVRKLAEERGAQTGKARERIAALEGELAGVRGEIERLQARLAELSQENQHWWALADELTRTLQSLRGSFSWRLTAPLRFWRSAVPLGYRRSRTLLRRVLGALARRSAKAVRWWMPGLFRVLVGNSLIRRIYERMNRPVSVAPAVNAVAVSPAATSRPAGFPAHSEPVDMTIDSRDTSALLTRSMLVWDLGRRIDG
ncbi:hypothetical protein Sp245p_27005 (plasmid) [Azospirillum baldaniorum]|uniref:Methyltransferase FkbM domain-containing protein n=1 Tax=Azospirillum baldaniorum TaxID=1064539 RepID=A0A9P1K1X0_9PROT|nr:FkbM family methyltransferase [Azospirillum baldaniorum]AWJ93509.1 hypothetical protein Sp245p_27005 [Azospirillum baldaniorum]TWA70279.1 FkbM family methyltransferase [Azospirillum brasilense]CCD04060.1 protein of unknown function [Azospirillum baldaniorum]